MLVLPAAPQTGCNAHRGTEDQRILPPRLRLHQGLDEAGDLDQGLVFVAFNQDLERLFATIQHRLFRRADGRLDRPVLGGCYLFAAPAPKRPGDWVGAGLFV